MKYMKMLGLAAIAALALMAFGAGSASATVLCTTNVEKNCGAGWDEPENTTIDASLASGETARLETLGGTVLDTCAEGTVKGHTTTTGGAGKAVSGIIDELKWGGKTNCTNTTDTLANGSLSISYSSGVNGTVTGSGSEVTVSTIFGSCVYGTGTGKVLGTLEGGTSPTLNINTTVKKISGNSTCPEETRWTAKYVVTSPTPLYIAES